MARKKRYPCPEPPCIHVVFDERRKIFRVFIEDQYEGGETIVTTIPADRLRRACAELRGVEEMGYREADDNETDFLARRYLHITRILSEDEEW